MAAALLGVPAKMDELISVFFYRRRPRRKMRIDADGNVVWGEEPRVGAGGSHRIPGERHGPMGLVQLQLAIWSKSFAPDET